MPETAEPIRLKAETLEAFTAYISEAENAMRLTESAIGPFLWADADPKRAAEIVEGKVIAQFWSGNKPVHVLQGLIHDWIGAASIPGTTVEQVLNLIQDYDNHTNIYKPDVLDSKLLARSGDDFHIFLRLLKKKVITVVLDTEHDVQYRTQSPSRCSCWSHTTRIAEVENYGKPEEKLLSPDMGYGYLWRLNSYWRFEQKDLDVWIECRAISLTRDVPKGLGWIIDPIVSKLPKESLVQTLTATRRA
jgi:hypothetical protein